MLAYANHGQRGLTYLILFFIEPVLAIANLLYKSLRDGCRQAKACFLMSAKHGATRGLICMVLPAARHTSLFSERRVRW